MHEKFEEYENRVAEFLIKCGLEERLAESIEGAGAKLECCPPTYTDGRPLIRIRSEDFGLLFYDVIDECWHGGLQPAAPFVAHILNEELINPFDAFTASGLWKSRNEYGSHLTRAFRLVADHYARLEKDLEFLETSADKYLVVNRGTVAESLEDRLDPTGHAFVSEFLEAELERIKEREID